MHLLSNLALHHSSTPAKPTLGQCWLPASGAGAADQAHSATTKIFKSNTLIHNAILGVHPLTQFHTKPHPRAQDSDHRQQGKAEHPTSRCKPPNNQNSLHGLEAMAVRVLD